MLLSLALLFGVLVQTDPYAGERKAYDETYSTGRETFNAAPNAFLVRTISGRKPGRALDVAMGQGRNALWLAAQGWAVTGFDISPVGIAEARREADRRKLRLDAVIAPFQEFDWGREKWDLILFSYYFPEDALSKAWTALKPGGLVVIETFHLDTARIRPIGRGLRDNELVRILQDYRVLHYEDVDDRQDWGLSYGATNRLVRALAQKPVPLAPGCTWEGRRYAESDLMCWGPSQWTCNAEGWRLSGRCAPQ